MCVGVRGGCDYHMRSRRQLPKPQAPQATNACLCHRTTPQTVHSRRFKSPYSWDKPVTGWSPLGQQQLVRNSELEGGSSVGPFCAQLPSSSRPHCSPLPSPQAPQKLSLVQVAQYSLGTVVSTVISIYKTTQEPLVIGSNLKSLITLSIF